MHKLITCRKQAESGKFHTCLLSHFTSHRPCLTLFAQWRVQSVATTKDEPNLWKTVKQKSLPEKNC